MEPDINSPSSPGHPAPLWVWLLTVALGAIAVYSGYTALSSHQLYLEGERARTDLAQQRDRLKANVADLTQQVERANGTRDEVENALKQSRADTEAASAQITELQKQISDQQRQIGELEKTRDAALKDLESKAKELESGSKDLEAAKTAAEQEVVSLKKQLADTQKKLSAAQADLKREREQISPVPMPPPGEQPQP